MKPEWERVLSGPNVWSERPVWELAFAATPTYSDEANRRCRQWLCDWLAEVQESLCLIDQSCVECPAWSQTPERPAAFLGWFVVEWQRLLGVPVERSWSELLADDRVLIAIEFEELRLAQACWETASRWWSAALDQSCPGPIELDVTRLRQIAFDERVGASTRAFMDAARARGLPVRRLEHESLIQLSYGARSRRLLTSLTDRATSIAEKISDDKWLTKSLLRDAGFPVAPGRLVRDVEDACRAARDLGWPVVVKPRDDDYGHGVSLHLTTEAGVRKAYELAKTFKPDILVERHASGVHHRLFVLHDQVVAAVRRDPAQVIGDGASSVRALIDAANLDPRRNDDDPLAPLWKLALSSEELSVLADQGLAPESIPAAGQRVPLRYDSRTSYGGTNVDCTPELHPQFTALAVDAARLIGLDVAGIDLLADDISQPVVEQSVTLLEINASPSILPHVAPLNETPKPMCDLVLDALFPTRESFDFPIIALAESLKSSWLARQLAAAWPVNSRTTGVSTREGIWVGANQLARRGTMDASAARTLLWHPRTEAAICELSWDSLRGDGLPFERSSVALLLESEPLLPRAGLRPDAVVSNDQISHRAASLLADHASGAVIVNVDDARLAEWAAAWPLMLPISRDPDHAAIVHIRQRGGRAAFIRKQELCLADGDEESRMPIGDLNPRDATPVLALVATIWALSGSTDEVIRWLHSSNERTSIAGPSVREVVSPDFEPQPVTPVAA